MSLTSMKIIFKKKKNKGLGTRTLEARELGTRELEEKANSGLSFPNPYALAPNYFCRGFIATFLVMSAMIMMTLGSLGAFTAAEGYDDSVARREYRLVAGQNAGSCVSLAL